jgi:xanthine dehydrogenase accessory factor
VFTKGSGNLPSDTLVLIKGAGDLATGVAVRLHRCGFPVIMTELPEPLAVRRAVAFAEAVYDGEAQVEEIHAFRVADVAAARAELALGVIPVLIDPEAACRSGLKPAVLVDAAMAKRNTGTAITDAPLVIALGPGFVAGVDCHVVIETNRGERLGRTIYEGSAEPDTGEPGEVGGKTSERVLRAPASGVLESRATIGEQVSEGQIVAMVGDHPVRAATAGKLRGMLRSGTTVSAGAKIGDVDPRGAKSSTDLISDKALAVAGGVLEAILAAMWGHR